MTCDRSNIRRYRQRLGMAGLATAMLVASGAAMAQDALAEGRNLAFDRGKGNCLSCHAIPGGDLPGTIGPSLAGVKARFPNRGDLVAILHDETQRNPQTIMPPFGRNLILTDKEIEAIVDFLNSL